MVLEPGHQPYLCSAGNIATPMDTAIRFDHTAHTLQSTQASTDPRILRQWRRQVAPTLGRRSVTHPAAPFPLTFSCRPSHIPSNINQTAFNVVVGWVALFGTFMPIFRHDSPFYAPFPRRSGSSVLPHYREWVSGGVERTAEDIASDRSSKVDGRIVEWTIGTLSEDDVTELFFEAIPGFCDSKLVQGRLSSLVKTKIRQVMDGFLDRTLTSETISESVGSLPASMPLIEQSVLSWLLKPSATYSTDAGVKRRDPSKWALL